MVTGLVDSRRGWEWFGKVGDHSTPTIDGRALGELTYPDGPLTLPLIGVRKAVPNEVIGLVTAVFDTGGAVFARGPLVSSWWSGLMYGHPLAVGMDIAAEPAVDLETDPVVSGRWRALYVYAPGVGDAAAWPDVAIHLRGCEGAARRVWTVPPGAHQWINA